MSHGLTAASAKIPVIPVLSNAPRRFGQTRQYQKASTGDAAALIDPDGYKKTVASGEKDFLTEFARQRALQAR